MKKFSLLMVLLSGSAVATTLPDPPKNVPVEQTQEQLQQQQQGQLQAQSADASADSRSTSSASATSSSGGNAQSISYSHQRSAPSLGQGSLMPAGCGMGANAGGSQPGGAAFLGFVFTTSECYKFILAQHLTAIGMVDSACDVLMSTRAATNAYKKAGLSKPKCDAPEAVRPVESKPTVVILESNSTSGLATKEELKRAFEASQGK